MIQTKNIKQLLKDSWCDPSESIWHSHVSMVNPVGKYQFSRESSELFWGFYQDDLHKNPDLIIGLAEKPQTYSPVLVDIDLKIIDDNQNGFKGGSPERSGSDIAHLYSRSQVARTIQIYQSVLRKIVVDCNDDNLTCILLEKPIYYITVGANRYIKNGFHLHFPSVFLSKVDHTLHLLPRVKEMMKENKVFLDLGIEDSSTVVDANAITVPWLIYGSRKSEDSQPYKFSCVYNSSCKEVSLDEAFCNYELKDKEEDNIDLSEEGVLYNLPRILSILPFGRITNEMKEGLDFPTRNHTSNTRRKEVIHLSLSADENLKIAVVLMPMLSDWRADDRNEWLQIGWCLYNIGDGSDEAFEMWNTFSQRSEKYDEASCIYEWDRMVKREKTIGTLKYYAKIDNPELFRVFQNSQAEPKLKEALNGSHNDIAQILKVYFGDEFRCASIESGGVWFQFRPDQHRWEEIEQGVFLREQISIRVLKDFIDMAKTLLEKEAGTTDAGDVAKYRARKKIVDKIIQGCKSAPFKNNVMREACEVFYDRTFKSKLDQNGMLIGFKNGVYDLKLNIFRDGMIDDYISKRVPIEYKEYLEVDNEVQEVKDFLHKVFPDASLRTYFLDVYSDIFVGGNSQKKVWFWTGEGDNGKSITQNFFDLMLGELAIKFNTTYFTGKKCASGAANPELSRAAPPVRHATMEEPDHDEQLNIGELKKLSGGDMYWARDLFEKGKSTREVQPMFKLTFICNKLPKLKYSDKATWNRIRVIPFESTFVAPGEDCPVSFDEQLLKKRFPMDRNFSSKIPGLVNAFAWYLLNWRKKVVVRIEPEKVKEATACYRKQNDVYRQFISEHILPVESERTSWLALTELYEDFKIWFKSSFPGSMLPVKNDVEQYFEGIWGAKTSSKGWKNFRLKTIDDNKDEVDA